MNTPSLNPLVSIIIPLYNAEQFIRQTIKSVLEQSYQNIEIIIIDDFSTDKSFELVSKINSEKIILIKNKKKGGCAARNYGFEVSKGEFIQYLDADDLISKDKIKNQVALLLDNESSIASCGWLRFTNEYEGFPIKKQVINKSYIEPYKWLVDAWTNAEMGLNSIWLTPRKIITKAGKWNENLRINQDGDFFCRVLLEANTIIYCENAVVYYRITPNSITQKKVTKAVLEHQLYSYHLYEGYLTNYINQLDVRKAIASNYLKFIYNNDRYYPELANTAREYFYKLDVGKPWLVYKTKNTFNKIASVIGIKFTLVILRIFYWFKNFV